MIQGKEPGEAFLFGHLLELQIGGSENLAWLTGVFNSTRGDFSSGER